MTPNVQENEIADLWKELVAKDQSILPGIL